MDEKNVTVSLQRRHREEGSKLPAEWCTITFHGEPDILDSSDVVYHFEQFCEALGIPESHVKKLIEANPEDYIGGLGPGGYFRLGLVTAQKLKMLANWLHGGITYLQKKRLSYAAKIE